MDHDLELFIPILEILEIEVCNTLRYPGNIGKWTFSMFSYPGNIGKLTFLFWEILVIWFFYILGFLQKRCAPKFHAEPTDQ